MTTYNTGNPVPSADARDRYDNSQTLDEVVNGESASYTTRTGKQVISLGGMNSRFNNAQDARESEFNLSQEEKQDAFQAFLEGTGWSSIGAYGAGVVITSHTQTVDYLGQPYSLKPSIPASLDEPYVTIGNWTTEGANFKLVGDNSLRQDLSSPGGADFVEGAQKVIRLEDYCTGDFNWTTKTGTSNTLDFRRAVAACPQGGKIVGKPGDVYYLNMQADGSVVDIIDKGIEFDFQTAGVAYKPYLDSDPAGTAAPALFFGSTGKTTYTVTAPVAFGASTLPLANSAGIVAGDYLVVSSNDLMNPWNFPDSDQAPIRTGSDVVKVRSVSGNNVTLFAPIQHDHVLPPTVTRVNMLEGVKVHSVGAMSGELDPAVLKTFAAGPRAGHFVSITDSNSPIAEDFLLMKGHRMMVVNMHGCYTPRIKAVRSRATTKQYRAQGGHQYTIALVTCFGAFIELSEGYGVRHVYDITDCTGTRSQNNRGFSCYGAFNSHGHRDYSWVSIDDQSYNDESTDNSGWTVGNFSFKNSDNVKIVRPYYRGGGIPITVGFTSVDVNIEDPDIITSHPNTFIMASGANRVKARRGSMRSTSTNPNPMVLLGAGYSIDLGSMTFTATAGVNPPVTVAGTKAHGLTVGKEIWLSLPDTASAQYAGRYTVSAVGSTLQFTATPVVGFTSTVALSFTTAWSTMNGRVTPYGSFKPIGSVEVSCSLTKDSAHQLGVISYSGNGQLTAQGFIGSGTASRYVIRMHGLLSSSAASFNVTDVQVGGETWGVLQPDNIRLDRRCVFARNTSNSHTEFAIQAIGISLSALQSAGLSFFDNTLETTAAKGVLNFHPFPVMFANPGKIMIRGNTYGTGYTDALGYNYERGTWTPTAGATTVTTPPTYANQLGRYSFDGATLNISFRVDWSGLAGSGDGYVSGFPFALAVPFNQPAPTAEFFATGLGAGDIPLLSLNSSARFVLRKLNSGVTGSIAAPAAAQMVVSCAIPIC